MSTDFVSQIRHQQTDYIIRSLLDVDFYKLTMGYFIHKNYPDVEVKFKLINRNPSIPLSLIIPEHELREQLDHVKTLILRRTDLYYLRGMDIYGKNMFSEDFLNFLSTLRLGDYDLRKNGDQFDLTFKGSWAIKTYWETISMSIISELYYRNLMKHMSPNDINIMYARATDKVYRKLTKIKNEAPTAKIADFGLRRRHSFRWHQHVLEIASHVLGDQLVGTSNTWLAFNQDLIPIGTNAHELPMVITAITDDDKKITAQFEVLKQWDELYDGALTIMLPDTYGSAQFYDNMEKYLPNELVKKFATEWRGQRQDSGDPVTECKMYMDWVKKHGGNPLKKTNIFSDGLNEDVIINLENQFKGTINTPYGWGTKLTNDFVGCLPNGNDVVPGMGRSFDDLFKPFSVVCKAVEADGKPAVKLSNNTNKATGPNKEIEKYLDIFGHKNIGKQDVVV